MKCFYPLTYTQKSIWNVERTYPNISINNITGTLRFKEELDFARLAEAANLLIQKNEALRIRFLLQNGEPVQYIAEYQYYQLNFFDLKGEDELFQIEQQLTEEPFSIIDSDLFYLAYFRLPGETAIFFKFYHLIADAWSLSLITDNMLNYYQRLKNGEKISEDLSPSYTEYISTEKQYLISEQFLKSKAFWETKVRTIPEFIYLKNKPLHYSIQAKRISFLISEEQSLKIKRFCDERKISIFTLFVAIFSIYIHQTTSKKDIVLGTTVLNRLNHKEKNTIGMFVNTIPVRLNVGKSMDFNTYVGYLSSEWKNILRHQRYPYNLIIKEYRHGNQVTEDLFDVSIAYQNAVLNSIKGFHQVRGRWHPSGHQTNSLNIHINDRESSNSYVVNLDYLIDLFTAAEIKETYQHLMNLLADALSHPDKPITKLELLSKDEQSRLLYEFNASYRPLAPENLHQLFEKQAFQNPQNIALVFGDKQLTFGELNKKAGQLAHLLRNKGVLPGTIVGMLVNRTFEMYIGILGILKAGGAYLPISTSCPEDRVKSILNDSNCTLLTTDIGGVDFDWNGEIIDLKDISENYQSNGLENRTQPHDPAYIIYTSGSTGKPKGVVIDHHSIVNTVKWRCDFYHFSSSEVLLQIPSYDFDSSVEDIFTFLSSGATIIIMDQDKRFDLGYFKKLIRTHHVTHILVTPTLYKTMLDEIAADLSNLTCVTVAGENFQPNLVKKHFEKLPQVKLYNEYGPTENSVCSTVYQLSPGEEEVLIGKPISNCQCYILNQELNLMPAGIPGELCLGGAGLARGYLNNPELTNDKFIFWDRINQRIYKTGDMVRWTPEGNLKFIERFDNQIKIRGFRVELDEIKNVILLFKGIKDAAVVVKEGHNSHTLICAYLVAEEPFELSELKEFLNLRLPNYMIPAHFLVINNLPLTPNGKVDVKNLPEVIKQQEEIVKPETELEKLLVKAWEEVLSVTIGITNDIFECGADSISIIQVLTILYDRNLNLSVQDFYKYRTIKELANYVYLTKNPSNGLGEENTLSTHSQPEPIPKRSPNMIRFLKMGNFKTQAGLSVNNSMANILLTGVTGFLGAHVLIELLRTTDARIFCLVRGGDEREAINKFQKTLHFYFPDFEGDLLTQRVTIVRGDLQENNLGISEIEYNQLFRTIDTVIHAAALVKHYGENRDFEKTNIKGVREVVKFSSQKHLYHISTTSISGNCLSCPGKRHFSEEQFDTGQNFSVNHYLQSKFEGEKIVREAILNGLHATIIRIGNLTGRYRDGHFQMNITENRFYNVLKSIIELKTIPKSILHHKLEFTPVDLCSEAIVKLLKLEGNNGRTFHLMNDNYLSMRACIKIFHGYGHKIKVLKDNDFHDYLKTVSHDLDQRHLLFGLITTFQNGRLNYNSSVIVDSKITKSFLRLLKFKWPKIDQEYLSKVITYMNEVSFLESRLIK